MARGKIARAMTLVGVIAASVVTVDQHMVGNKAHTPHTIVHIAMRRPVRLQVFCQIPAVENAVCSMFKAFMEVLVSLEYCNMSV